MAVRLRTFNFSGYREDGLIDDGSLEISKILEQAGVNAIEVSGGDEAVPDISGERLNGIQEVMGSNPTIST